MDNDDNIDNWRSGVPRIPPFFSIPAQKASTNQKNFSTLLEDAMTVEVGNSRGSFTARLVISERVRLGVASTTKGQWPKLTGGSAANATTLEGEADMGAGPLFHDNQVNITPRPGELTEPDFVTPIDYSVATR